MVLLGSESCWPGLAVACHSGRGESVGRATTMVSVVLISDHLMGRSGFHDEVTVTRSRPSAVAASSETEDVTGSAASWRDGLPQTDLVLPEPGREDAREDQQE